MTLDVLYFASLREAIGRDGERIAPPDAVATVGALVDWLAARGTPYEEAFADRTRLRAAVDQAFARMDSPIAGAREIALFPPVTGG